MARRCPNSKYIGRATLPHYRWMINQRGFANVVPSRGDWVEGLVFEIDSDDEQRLDKSEGVTKRLYVEGEDGPTAPCYRKEYKTLRIHRAPKSLYRRPVPWIVGKGGVARVLSEAELEGSSGRRLPGETRSGVLVYASPDFMKDGNPREEYITRINCGVVDARALGVTQDYIERFIRKTIPPDGQATTGSTAYPLKEKVQPQIHPVVNQSRGLQRVQNYQQNEVQSRSYRSGRHSAEEVQTQIHRTRHCNGERSSTPPRPRSQSQVWAPLPPRPGSSARLGRSSSLSRRGEERPIVSFNISISPKLGRLFSR